MRNYLAVFTSDRTGPKWRAWYAMTDAERAEADRAGFVAITDWNQAHIVNEECDSCGIAGRR